MFYLTTHSTHFIYCYMALGKKLYIMASFIKITFKKKIIIKDMDGNVLFNDTLNTFYLLLYGIGKKIKCRVFCLVFCLFFVWFL